STSSMGCSCGQCPSLTSTTWATSRSVPLNSSSGRNSAPKPDRECGGSGAKMLPPSPRGVTLTARRVSPLRDDDHAVAGLVDAARCKVGVERAPRRAAVGTTLEEADGRLASLPRTLRNRREGDGLARHDVPVHGSQVDLRALAAEQLREHRRQARALRDLRHHQADEVVGDHKVVDLRDLRELAVALVEHLAYDVDAQSRLLDDL